MFLYDLKIDSPVVTRAIRWHHLLINVKITVKMTHCSFSLCCSGRSCNKICTNKNLDNVLLQNCICVKNLVWSIIEYYKNNCSGGIKTKDIWMQVKRMWISGLLLQHSDKYSHSPVWTVSPRICRAGPSLCTCSCPAGEYGQPGRTDLNSLISNSTTQYTHPAGNIILCLPVLCARPVQPLQHHIRLLEQWFPTCSDSHLPQKDETASYSIILICYYSNNQG